MIEDTLYGKLSVSGKAVKVPYPVHDGVSSFNSRTGDVVPEMNDYTYEQVGAFPATELLTNSDILDI